LTVVCNELPLTLSARSLSSKLTSVVMVEASRQDAQTGAGSGGPIGTAITGCSGCAPKSDAAGLTRALRGALAASGG